MKRNVKVYIILVIISIFSIILPISVYADETTNNNINISIISEKIIYSSIINCEVKVNYSDEKLYNNGQYLSYHIYDSSNDLLNYECARIPIVLNDKMDFEIDLSNYIDLKSINEAHIVFDIVDENEAYWMSTNYNIELKTEEIKYEKNEFKRITNMYQLQLLENKAIVFLNAIPWICILIFFIKRRHKSAK